MKQVTYCRFNIDTASVETRFSDGTSISIYTPGVDATLDITTKQQTEVDWLIYNDPTTYVNLVLSGDLESYAKNMSGFHSLED